MELLAAKGFGDFGTGGDPAGQIDVPHNSAGTGIIGAADEIPPDRANRLFKIDFFRVMRMTNAVLPLMRARRAVPPSLFEEAVRWSFGLG